MKKRWQAFKDWVEDNRGIIMILLVVSLLRVPNLFEPAWYGDEGIYLAVGQGIKRGLVLYKEIFDHKPPIIYWLAALSGELLWFKVIGIITNLLSIVVIHKISDKLFSKKTISLVVTSFFALITTLPWIEGNLVNAELLFILTTSLAVWILIKKRMMNVKWADMLLAGFVLGIGVLLKAPVLLDIAAISIWFIAFRKGLRIYWGEIWKVIVLGVGVLIPSALAGVYFWMEGVLSEYLIAAWGQNFSYLSSWGGGEGLLTSDAEGGGLMMRVVVLIVWLLIVWWWTRKEKVKIRLVVVWFGMALFGALLAGRPYPHYLIQIAPAGALLIGVIWETKNKGTVLSACLGLMLLVVAIFRYDFGFYKTVEYYKNFGRYVAGKIGQAQYYDNFDWRVSRNYQIGKYIKERTDKNDRIYIWSDEPNIYVLSERSPAGKWVMAYHIDIFDKRDEVLEAIKEQKPKFILWPKEGREFKALASYRDAQYIQVEEFEGLKIYRRMSWKQ